MTICKTCTTGTNCKSGDEVNFTYSADMCFCMGANALNTVTSTCVSDCGTGNFIGIF